MKSLVFEFEEAGHSALRMVSAWASDESLCLGQIAVDDHSNEITAVPKLLEIAGPFRRVALSLLKRNTTVKASLRGKRLMAGWNPEVPEQILSGKLG